MDDVYASKWSERPWKDIISRRLDGVAVGTADEMSNKCDCVRRAHKRENDRGNVTVMWTSIDSDGEWPLLYRVSASPRTRAGDTFFTAPTRQNAMHVRASAPPGLRWHVRVRGFGVEGCLA
jgi:hypothetical protein